MADVRATHDPQKTLSDLRDHLARHDKPIAFFFGAGTSCAIRMPDPANKGKTLPLIPAVAGLTEISREKAGELGDEYRGAWAAIEAHCTAIGQDPNIENILSRLRMMMSAVNDTDTLSGLNKSQLERLEDSVRKTIANVVTPDLSGIPSDCPHRKFARWLLKSSRQAPVEIFTVNYDVLIEYALEAERIPTFDGFVGGYQPFFHPDSLRRTEAAPGANWTRLWKMHGSVAWQRIEQDGKMRIIRGAPNPAGEMIYPSFLKYDESRQQPYSAITERLSRFLEQDDALLIVAGCSFGDEHINNLVFGALENRPRTHVYALQFEELPDTSDLVRRAHYRPNMIVIGPETGIIGGRRAPWTPSELPSSMAVAFELMAEPPTGTGVQGGDPGKQAGLMKIGGFGSFCDFLESMTSG